MQCRQRKEDEPQQMVPSDFPATLRGRRAAGSSKGKVRGGSSPVARQQHGGPCSRKAMEDLHASMRGYGSSTVSPCSSFSSSKPPRVDGHALDHQASFTAPTPPSLPKGVPHSRCAQASPPMGGEEPSLEQLEALQNPSFSAERPGGPVQAEISEVSDGPLVELPGESRILGGRMDRNNWPSLRQEPLGPMLRSLEFQVGALFELMDAHCMRQDSDFSVTEVINMKRDSVEEAFQAVREALWWQQRPAKGQPQRPTKGHVSSFQSVLSGLGDGLPPSSGFLEQDSNGLQELEALQSQLAKRVAAVFEGDKPAPPLRPPPRNVLQQQWQQQQHHELLQQQMLQQREEQWRQHDSRQSWCHGAIQEHAQAPEQHHSEGEHWHPCHSAQHAQQAPATTLTGQESAALPSAAAPCGESPGAPTPAGAEWLNQLQASWAAGASAAWWAAAASAASKACFSCQAVEEAASAAQLAGRTAPSEVPQEPVAAWTTATKAQGEAAVWQQTNSLGLPPLVMTPTSFHFKNDRR